MIGYHLEDGGSSEIERPKSRRWKNLGRTWTKGGGRRGEEGGGGGRGIENWTILMDVICVSPLMKQIFFNCY